MRISFSRHGAIGLDVGSQWVKAVQLSHGGPSPRVTGCAAFPRLVAGGTPTADELREIGAILGRQGLVGRNVVIAAPGDKLRGGILELPAKAAGLPLEQIARAEFARVHKVDTSAAELSWWELPAGARSGKGTAVMAVACPHADAEPYVATFEQAGFRVRAMDVPTSALARGCASLLPGTRSFGVLELGASCGTVVLVRDGAVVYERRIPDTGTDRLTASLQSRLGANAEAAEYVIREIGVASDAPADRFAGARELIVRYVEGVVTEVRRTLAYASHQYADSAAQALLLCGGGAGIPRIREYLAGQVATDVRLATFEALAGEDDVLRRLTPSAACALGLARFS